MKKTIKQLSKEIHENAKNKGFYDRDRNTGETIALIHSEVSEALEADRDNKYCQNNIVVVNGWVSDEDFTYHFKKQIKDTFEDELADIIIRVMDLAEFKDIDLQAHIEAKMRYNSLREHKHGKRY